MATALKTREPVEPRELIAERDDGSRVRFMPYPTPLFDAEGRLTGAVNMLIDVTDLHNADVELAHLAAIISSSDDAIISKMLDGTVRSWNAGAERIFGYTPEEMIGQPIIRIIPPELQGEEKDILARLARGERIDHFETVRVAKDGRRLNISLTVSPVRDRFGRIVGASKVARDITERKRAEEMQRLLFDELNHRVKNTLATVQSIASQSLRMAEKPSDFVASFNGRVHALARAHDLLVQEKMQGAEIGDIVRDQVLLGAPDGQRIDCNGPRVRLNARVAVQLALVLHELATNARKYGALSTPNGKLAICLARRRARSAGPASGMEGKRRPERARARAARLRLDADRAFAGIERRDGGDALRQGRSELRNPPATSPRRRAGGAAGRACAGRRPADRRIRPPRRRSGGQTDRHHRGRAAGGS